MTWSQDDQPPLSGVGHAEVKRSGQPRMAQTLAISVVLVAAGAAWVGFEWRRSPTAIGAAIEVAGCEAESRRAGYEFRDKFRSGGEGPLMVVLPSGRFEQGSPSHDSNHGADELPLREVSVAGFSIGKFEVTRREFRQFVDATGYRSDAERNTPVEGIDNPEGCHKEGLRMDIGWEAGTSWRNVGFPQDDTHPVVCVSHNDAQSYTEWLRRESGKPYRLPTESELEYAIRGGTTSWWPWGDDGDAGCRHANYSDPSPGFSEITQCDDRYEFTAPAGSFRANAFGLHDTSGNVLEWTQDCWNHSYDGAPLDGRAWTSGDCAARVVRGGSWFANKLDMRAARRDGYEVTNRDNTIGFRVAQD